MKKTIQNLLAKIQPVLSVLKRNVTFIFIIMMLGIFGFLIYRINYLANVDPSSDALQQKLKTAGRPKIDQSVLDKIQQLQDQNIQVQSLFDKARSNPFNEQ